MMMRLHLAILVAAVALFAACGGGDAPGDEAGAENAEDSQESSSDYRVILGNALTDTLRGDAGFGTVLEPESGNRRFIIRLESDFDFAGGFIIARRDTSLPAAGSFSLDVATDSLAGAPADEFIFLYREGMLREMRVASGDLTLSAVTDSLISGTFDVTLRGRLAGRTGDAEVHAVGRFRAERGLEGFVIGL